MSNLIRAAEIVAAARIAWAQDFLRFRAVQFQTDAQAKAAADEAHLKRVLMAEAMYELTKWQMWKGTDDGVPEGTDREPTQAEAHEGAAHPDSGD